MTTTPHINPQPLDYATPMPARRGGLHWVLVLFAALALGFLAMDPSAMIAGMDHETIIALQVIFGAILFGLVLAASGPLSRLALGITHAIARSQGKPSQAVTLTLIGSGIVCVLAALGIELYLIRSATMMVSAAGFGVMNHASEHITIGARTPILGHLLTALTFLLGATLCAIGIWGSIPTREANAATSAERTD